LTLIEDYVPKIRAGSDWLESKLRPDGSFGKGADNLAYYYKAPWGFAAGGSPWLSSLVADRVKDEFLLIDGDLELSDELLNDQWTKYLHFYYAGWLIHGLQKVGRYDVTYKAMRFLDGFQDGSMGGFYSSKARDQSDVLTSALCGLCCLGSGELERAKKTGDYLASTLRKQEDGDIFYNATSTDGELITEFSEDARLYFVVDKASLDQWYFHLGLPIAFLVKLYEAGGDLRHLRTAEQYFAVAEGCREDVFRWNGTGKLSWGSALLFRHTRESKYQRAALSIIRGLFRAQTKEGGFLSLRSTYKSLREQPLLDSIDSTAETIALGSETIQALSTA
jgi:hypothetical protein